MLDPRCGNGEYLDTELSCRRNRLDRPRVRPVPPQPTEAIAVNQASSGWNAIMQYSFLRVFADDGTISADELAMFQRLAMADGVVDDKERSVLAKIFARVNEQTVTHEVWEGIARFKAQHQIP